MRYAARADNTQRDIVKGLRALGYIVEIQKKPVDLKVRHESWLSNVWVQAECKTPNLKGGRHRLRTDLPGQKEQFDYCKAHAVPYWLSLEEAIYYLRLYSTRLAV